MIYLALLGNVDLVGENGAPLDAQLRRSKRVALLAYLAAARPTGFHRRDKIAALFWPELQAERARGALRTTLSRLRDDHGPHLIVARGADEIAVDPALLRCDVWDFEAAAAAGRTDEAVALYRGPFLDALHVEGSGEELEDWIAAERTRLLDIYVRALSASSSTAEQRGDVANAIAMARRALDAAPHDEVLARRVISLMIASGNRGGAMREHAELARRLRHDLGVDPAAETDALVAPLRVRAMPAAASSTSTTSQSLDAHDAPSASPSVPASQSVPVASAPSRRHSYVLVAAAAIATLVVASWITFRSTPTAAAAPAVEWQFVSTVGSAPTGSFGARAVVDSTGNALLVFGGVADVERRLLVPIGEGYWRLRGLGDGDAATWTRMRPAPGPHPSPRWLVGASSDAAHDRVILHGGALGFTSPCARDTWILDHASGIGHVPEWKRVTIRGAEPPPRAGFDLVYDATRRRLIMFAGHDCIFPRFDDTWVLAFDDSSLASGAWSRLVVDTSAGIPVHRDSYVAAYDTASARFFIYGGRGDARATGELWVLDNVFGSVSSPSWHPLQCAGDHPVLVAPAAAMDFANDDWTFFGGMDATGEPSRSVWRIHGLLRDTRNCQWRRLTQSDPSPAARASVSGALLAGQRGMVIFGGEFRNTPFADAWVLKPGRVR